MTETGKSPRAARPRTLKIAVIGAGMSGLLAAIKLRESGHTDVAVFEKDARVGGTWRDNTYPGLTCDVPSHHYCYSFELNPEWTQLFASGAEIQRYFENAANKYQLDEIIRFGREIVSAEFQSGRWHLRAQHGDEFIADIVIAATGVLHQPVIPEINGRDDFAGAQFHSAR